MYSCFIILISALLTVFPQMPHPMSLASILILFTLIIAIYLGSLLSSFWLSYILFLMFLGGLLILFTYVSSLTPNIQLTMINPWLTLTTLIIFSSMFSYLSSPPIKPMNPLTPILKTFFPLNIIPTMIITLFLLYTLLMTMKIIKMSMGPLRANS